MWGMFLCNIITPFVEITVFKPFEGLHFLSTSTIKTYLSAVISSGIAVLVQVYELLLVLQIVFSGIYRKQMLWKPIMKLPQVIVIGYEQ
jgi:hypothetical protein